MIMYGETFNGCHMAQPSYSSLCGFNIFTLSIWTAYLIILVLNLNKSILLPVDVSSWMGDKQYRPYPNQMSHSTASDLGLHYRLRPINTFQDKQNLTPRKYVIA